MMQTGSQLEQYLAKNYPAAKGESLADRVIDALETMDIALGTAAIAQPVQPAIEIAALSKDAGRWRKI